MYLGNSPTNVVRIEYRFVATAGQTVFSGSDYMGRALYFNPLNYDVYINGAKLDKLIDVASTTTSTLTLTVAANASDIVEIYAYGNWSLGDLSTSVVRGFAGINNTGGTGSLLYKDGTGTFVPFAAGTAGQKLRQNTALTAPEWETSWETIGVSSPSGVATLDFTGLSAFRKLRITGWLKPATDNVSLYLRTSTDNGSTYDSGASDYVYNSLAQATSTVVGLRNLDSMFRCDANFGVGNAANELLQFNINIDLFNQATWLYGQCHSLIVDQSTNVTQELLTCARLSTTARNAIRFQFSGGNIASGVVCLEGMRG